MQTVGVHAPGAANGPTNRQDHGMEQRISLITLAVRDLDASRRFFVDGLGWEAFLDVDDVLMLRVGEHLLLSLWASESFTAEVGPSTLGTGIAQSHWRTTSLTMKRSTRPWPRWSDPEVGSSSGPHAASGAVTPATRPIRTAIAGRSPTPATAPSPLSWSPR